MGGPFKVARAGRNMLLVLAVSLALAPLARAQDNNVSERLDRIERDLNMLQREVYGGGPARQHGSQNPNVAVGNAIRLQQLEGEMRHLTGRVEDTMNAVKVLRQRVNVLANAVGARAEEAPGATAAPPTGAATPGPPNASGAAPPQASPQLAPPGYWRSPKASRPLPGGALAPSRRAAARAQSASAEERPRAPAQSLGGGQLEPAGSALAQYSHAFALLKSADYSGAARAMMRFLREHPNDPLAANAQYWLGETYYVRGRYREAANAFASGFKNYPNASKAPDDLLKLGMSLARTGQKKNACVAFAELRRVYPHPGRAVAERAGAEQKRLGC